VLTITATLKTMVVPIMVMNVLRTVVVRLEILIWGLRIEVDDVRFSIR
jgi:hypothetical protein